MINKENLLRELDEQKYVEELQHSKGWQLIKKHFEACLCAITDKLKICTAGELVQLQERYRAFNAILSYVEDSTQITQRIWDDLQCLLDEEKFTHDYALDRI